MVSRRLCPTHLLTRNGMLGSLHVGAVYDNGDDHCVQVNVQAQAQPCLALS